MPPRTSFYQPRSADWAGYAAEVSAPEHPAQLLVDLAAHALRTAEEEHRAFRGEYVMGIGKMEKVPAEHRDTLLAALQVQIDRRKKSLELARSLLP